MTVAVDSEMAGAAGVSSTNAGATFTGFLNNVGGTLLVVVIGAGVASGAATFNTQTYGGQALTPLLTQTPPDGVGIVGLFYRLAPLTGSQDLVVDIAWTPNALNRVWAGGISFTGNNASTPFVQQTSGNGNSGVPTATLGGVASGNLTFAAAGCGSAMSAQSQTLSWLLNIDGNTNNHNARASRSAATGSVTHNFTSGVDQWTTIMVEVAAAPTGVPGPPPMLGRVGAR